MHQLRPPCAISHTPPWDPSGSCASNAADSLYSIVSIRFDHATFAPLGNTCAPSSGIGMASQCYGRPTLAGPAPNINPKTLGDNSAHPWECGDSSMHNGARDHPDMGKLPRMAASFSRQPRYGWLTHWPLRARRSNIAKNLPGGSGSSRSARTTRSACSR